MTHSYARHYTSRTKRALHLAPKEPYISHQKSPTSRTKRALNLMRTCPRAATFVSSPKKPHISLYRALNLPPKNPTPPTKRALYLAQKEPYISHQKSPISHAHLPTCDNSRKTSAPYSATHTKHTHTHTRTQTHTSATSHTQLLHLTLPCTHTRTHISPAHLPARNNSHKTSAFYTAMHTHTYTHTHSYTHTQTHTNISLALARARQLPPNSCILYCTHTCTRTHTYTHTHTHISPAHLPTRNNPHPTST